MIHEDLRTFMLSCEGLTNLVGKGDAARIFPLKLPQDTPVGLVYTPIDSPRDYALDGRTGLATARIQLDLVNLEATGQVGAAKFKAAKTALDALRNILDGYAGGMGESVVQMARIENDRSEWDETTRGYLVGFDVVLIFDEG